MFGVVSNACQSYYDDLPDNTLQTVGKSALLSFSLSLMFKDKLVGEINLSQPLASAEIASLASLIYSLTNPIFNKIFGDNNLHFHRELIKAFVNMAIASTLVMYITAGKVDFAAFQWLSGLPVNLIFGQLNDIPTLMDWIEGMTFPNFNPQDPNTSGNRIRILASHFGLNAVPGAGSVYWTTNVRLRFS